MNRVAVEKSESYDIITVRKALRDLLYHFDGMGQFVKPGDRVLIKPNMLMGKAPEAAVTTHPSILQGVIELVREAGGTPVVGDSPGFGSSRSVAAKSGLFAVVEATGAELADFSTIKTVIGTGRFKRFEVAEAYLNADKVINLPKLKTHEMMTMTCGVKNLFGIVVGKAKPAWHLRAGDSKELFARMLLELYQIREPDLTIVDAVTAMEGNGPGSGDPYHVGLLLAGTNALAVDVIAAEIAQIPKKRLFVEREAEALQLNGWNRNEIETVGLALEDVHIKPFKLPPIADVQFGLPKFLKKHLRNQLTTRPFAIKGKCLLCGVCVSACPPKVISIKNKALCFDYSGCIRCFCCRELCPHSALDVREGFLLKLLNRKNKFISDR
ncbi:MAG: DUF362 domain-containing protein [Desulfuromonadales bacterium]|nr:DUF362 domain-containing protein [Desulfuromonadales bacterium]